MKDESQQLRETYAQMFDGELEHLAGDMDNLTETAKPLLRAEMSRRGLSERHDSIIEPDLILVPAEGTAAPDDSKDNLDTFVAIPDYESMCPQCHSPDIVFLALEPPQGFEPEAEPKFHWICDACHYEWVDDGLEAQA